MLLCTNSLTWGTWAEINTSGLPSVLAFRRAFVKTLNGDFYVATDTVNGIYVSTDGGTSWASAGTGLGMFASQVFPGDMMISSNGYLFASPSNSGIHRSMVPVQTNTALGEPKPSVLTADVFPNPSSGDFSVAFQAEKAGRYTMAIYSTAGVKVYEEIQQVGPGQQEINVEVDLVPGLYLVEVKGNGKKAILKMLVK